MKRSLAIGLASLTLLAFKIAPGKPEPNLPGFSPFPNFPAGLSRTSFKFPKGMISGEASAADNL